jgi:hypothetical protein
MQNRFLEQSYLEKVIRKLSSLGSLFQYETLAEIRYKDQVFPIYGLQIGPNDKSLPVLGLFGGVHGLEKIGTHVIANYLNSLSNRITLNDSLKKHLEQLRFVSIPLVNPVGMYLNQRSNVNGVDLMRNAPVLSTEVHPLFFAAGQTWTPKLPWYRGNPEDMELENKALFQFVQKHLFDAPFSLALDIHSGFGMRDRMWYPYGKSMNPYPDELLARKMARYFKVTNPFHNYKFEKQSDSYLIHGDMWDYMYDQFKEKKTSTKFLPWTLEIGSWSWWLSKPHRLLNFSRMFHTNDTRKYNRVMRKHWGLLDFFKDMTIHHKTWAGEQRSKKNLNRIVGF